MASSDTPVHSRNASHGEFQASPVSCTTRRLSRSSFQESHTSQHTSLLLHDGVNVGDYGGGLGGVLQDNMENLAAELGDAWDGEEDADDDGEYYEGAATEFDPTQSQEEVAARPVTNADSKSAPLPHRSRNGVLSSNGLGHMRAGSEYDGSEYGSSSDLDSGGMPPGLVAKMDAVEHLARRGTEVSSGHADGVFKRVSDTLRDLESQANIEGNATRLITAHTALATHITHQHRQFHNLSYAILNPLAPPPDSETIDDLVPLLQTLLESMPRPTKSAFAQLGALHAVTSDLVQTLSYVSDTLQMTKQATTTAARRLRSAKELVAELRVEEELKEAGEKWLEKGNWNERLRKRECANVCGEVVGGFEEVCNSLRAQMIAQAGATQA